MSHLLHLGPVVFRCADCAQPQTLFKHLSPCFGLAFLYFGEPFLLYRMSFLHFVFLGGVASLHLLHFLWINKINHLCNCQFFFSPIKTMSFHLTQLDVLTLLIMISKEHVINYLLLAEFYFIASMSFLHGLEISITVSLLSLFDLYLTFWCRVSIWWRLRKNRSLSWLLASWCFSWSCCFSFSHIAASLPKIK